MANAVKQEKAASTPGLIVLQWLTYVFWAWTISATAILFSIVITDALLPNTSSELSAYAIAAVLVLLPISIVCDILYSRKEPKHKSGAASVVMIIHAVLFALSGIAALIGIVISLVQLMISSSDVTSTQIALCTDIVVMIICSLIFLRILMPQKLFKFHKLFLIVMAIIISVISIFGFIGPVANAQLTRDDRLIDNNLSYVQSGIDYYTNSNNKLPGSLDNISLSGDAKVLISRKLVTYKSNTLPSEINKDVIGIDGLSTATFFYQLCVNYKKSAVSSGVGTPYAVSSDTNSNNSYESYASTYSHPAGEYCYKLQTSAYGNKYL